MKPLFACLTLALCVWSFSVLTAEQKSDKPAPAKVPAEIAPEKEPQPESAADEVTFPAAEAITGKHSADDLKAVQDAVRAYGKAYNAHDAKALAAMFTADAELIDDSGRVTQGRAAIEKLNAGQFQKHPDVGMVINVESIRFLSDVTAVEEGSTTMIVGPAEAPVGEVSRYSATHVKLHGKWWIVSARDIPPQEIPGSEHLKQLEWLVGDWVDENGNALVSTKYRWSEDKNYLLSDFTIQIGGRPPVKGTQRIGWDPRSKQLHSWSFDSNGGFGEALWTQDGDRWIAKATGVNPDGQVGSATNILTRVSAEQATFQSRDRVSGGASQPDIEEILVVRKPPAPTAP